MKTCLLIHMWATIPWHLHVKTTVCSVFIFAEHEFCKNSTNIFIRLMRWRMKTHVRSIFFSVDKWLKFFSLLNCKYGPIKQHIEFPLFLLHFLNRSSMRRAAVNFICTSIELLYIYRCAHNTKYKLVNRIFWTVRGSSWMWGSDIFDCWLLLTHNSPNSNRISMERRMRAAHFLAQKLNCL